MMLPEAPSPTTASILFDDFTLNEAAGVLPNLTAVVPVKPEPAMLNVSPAFEDNVAGGLITGASI